MHGLIRHHSKVYSQEPARRLLLTTPAGNDAGNGHGHGHGTGEIHYHYGDVLDSFSLIKILRDANPDEIYHLAAQSHVGLSFTTSLSTSQVDALGTLRILEAIQALGLANKIRFYNACSSEVYGAVNQQHALKMLTQDENTPFNPRSPYAVAKLYSYYTTVIFRDRGVFAVNGILFNHESPRRGQFFSFSFFWSASPFLDDVTNKQPPGMDFVTRKISRAVALIYHGEDPQLTLGNLDAFRDWGHARDYVRGMWMMMQQAEADDYVLATGETHSVRTFCEQAFRVIGITLKWQGQGLAEVGIDSNSKTSGGGRVLVKVDSALERPLEVGYLRGSAKKAEEKLGWKPEITFQQLVREMVTADIEAIGNGLNLKSVDGPQL